MKEKKVVNEKKDFISDKIVSYFIFEDESLSGYLSTCAMFAEWSGGSLARFFQRITSP